MTNEKNINEIRRVMTIYKTTKGVIRPHFVVTGSSGSGKTHAIEMLCQELHISKIDVNAAQLTKEGTSGNSLSKALAPLSNIGDQLCLVFVDEFDKLFISGNQNSDLAHETTNGVQNEFLKVLEGKTTSVFGDYGKYNDVPVDRVLFVFAGAFNGEQKITVDRLREMGIKTEFLGRVPLIYNMEKITIEDMRNILNNMPLLAHYLRLFSEYEKQDVVEAIMCVVRDNYEKNTIGCRVLNALLHQYFINDGDLTKNKIESTTFQTDLSTHPAFAKEAKVSA